jgi:hypothetical protein
VGRQELDAFNLAAEVSDCGKAAGISGASGGGGRCRDHRGRGLLLAAVFINGGRTLGSGDRSGGDFMRSTWPRMCPTAATRMGFEELAVVVVAGTGTTVAAVFSWRWSSPTVAGFGEWRPRQR